MKFLVFDKILKWIRENPREFVLLLVILVIGAFLRLYKISEYMTFLGDEGRDVIVVRRLLVNLDLILIGPGTSIGNMYLGPLYYYMMAPALFLASYSPVGPAIQIALLGVATIFFVWFVAREWFGRIAAFSASLLYAISPTVIIHSRSSWNPNIMPFFALLVIYSVWQFWLKRKFRWLLVTGISLALVLQSHYLGLLLIPVIGLFWLLTLRAISRAWPSGLRDKRRERGSFLRFTIFGLLIFGLLMSPLVIFDARHDWRNLSAMQEFFAKRQTTVSARPWKAIPKVWPIFEKLTVRLLGGKSVDLGRGIALGLIASLALLIVKFKKSWLKKKNFLALTLIFTWLFFALLGLGLYKQEIYDHYYGFFFAAPFLLVGAIAEYLMEKVRKHGSLIVGFGLAILIVASLKENPLKYPPNRQLNRTVEVAEKIQKEAGSKKFNLAVIAERNYEGAYWYFLESSSAPIVGIDPQLVDETVADQLFVVCELPREKCQPTSNPKAEIANFGWSKIDEEWNIAGVILFKLVHNN